MIYLNKKKKMIYFYIEREACNYIYFILLLLIFPISNKTLLYQIINTI